MYIFRITIVCALLAAAFAVTGCIHRQKDKALEENLTLFTHYFFNWHLREAQAYCTPDSKAQLVFLASNITPEDIAQLHESPTAHVETTDIRHASNDSVAMAFFTVSRFLEMNEPGKPLETVEKAAFSLQMIRQNGQWKAQLATLRKE